MSSFWYLISILSIGMLIPHAYPFVTAELSDDYLETFEALVFPAWTATSLWHLENNNTSSYPMYGLPSDSHYMWYGDNRTGNYYTSNINFGELYSDVIDLSLEFNDLAYLGFWSWADTEVGDIYDLKRVFISPDNGNSWEYLGNIIVDGDPKWEHVTFDISPYVSFNSVILRFDFDTVDSGSNDGRGWAIDNVRIVDEITKFTTKIETMPTLSPGFDLFFVPILLLTLIIKRKHRK